MNKKIGERIRKIRTIKGYSQANIAEDLGITHGAYAKIERGETDANSSRLIQIAKILEVNVSEFFEDPANIKEHKSAYGYASKEEVDRLSQAVLALIKEFENFRREFAPKKKLSKKTYKIKRK